MAENRAPLLSSPISGSIVVPAPLRIVKKPSQHESSLRLAQPASYQPQGGPSSVAIPCFPPRSSSMKRHDSKDRCEISYHDQQNQDQDRAHSEIASNHSADSSRISSSSNRSSYSIGSHRADGPCVSAMTAATSETATHNQQFLPDTSAEILGDFIAFNSTQTVANTFKEKGNGRVVSNAHSHLGQYEGMANPYEFEPNSPLFESLNRQTTVSNFISSQDYAATKPRRYHLKNICSEGNANPSPRPSSFVVMQTPRGRNLHRSESSPSTGLGRFTDSPHRTPSPDIPSYYYGELDTPVISNQRGRSTIPHSQRNRVHNATDADVPGASIATDSMDPVLHRGRLQVNSKVASFSRKLSRQADMSSSALNTVSQHKHTASCFSYSDSSTSHSPARASRGNVVNNFNSRSGSLAHQLSTSPAEDGTQNEPVTEPKKRSHSPMKKMFGENGWLGRSPSEVNGLKVPPKKIPVEKKPNQPSKPTMMSKIKNKFEGFAEKADFSPAKPSRGISGKTARPAILAISLSPPEQARVYMELELMLVHTANCFLMAQFSQGRIAIDTIKKTVDSWKSKGRPGVIEFMYEQATQRELVASNQHTFRFHGERAGDGIRINSMLYNWKQVASHMSIRTFCNADTVTLKLLFDIGQILELLGAAEGILLRYQSIRLSVNEKVHNARTKSATDPNFVNGRELLCGDRHPSENFSRRHASVDPYGGMKPVPESYANNER